MLLLLRCLAFTKGRLTYFISFSNFVCSLRFYEIHLKMYEKDYNVATASTKRTPYSKLWNFSTFYAFGWRHFNFKLNFAEYLYKCEFAVICHLHVRVFVSKLWIYALLSVSRKLWKSIRWNSVFFSRLFAAFFITPPKKGMHARTGALVQCCHCHLPNSLIQFIFSAPIRAVVPQWFPHIMSFKQTTHFRCVHETFYLYEKQMNGGLLQWLHVCKS